MSSLIATELRFRHFLLPFRRKYTCHPLSKQRTKLGISVHCIIDSLSSAIKLHWLSGKLWLQFYYDMVATILVGTYSCLFPNPTLMLYASFTCKIIYLESNPCTIWCFRCLESLEKVKKEFSLVRGKLETLLEVLSEHYHYLLLWFFTKPIVRLKSVNCRYARSLSQVVVCSLTVEVGKWSPSLWLIPAELYVLLSTNSM